MKTPGTRQIAQLAFMVLLSAATVSCGLWIDDAARIERARDALLEQSFSAAIIDLRVVLQKSPDNVEARKLLGHALSSTGDPVGAAKEFSRALELGLPLDEIRLELAAAYIDSERPDLALDIADPESAADDQEAFSLWIHRGDAQSGLGRGVAALQSYEQALDLHIDDARALLRMSDVLWDAGNLRGARHYAERAVRADERRAAAHIALARIDLEAGLPQAAAERLQRALRLNPLSSLDEGFIHYYLGMVALEQDDHSAARRALTRVSELWPPGDPDLLFLAGSVALAEGDFDSAARQLLDYLDRHGDSTSVRRMLGEVQLERGLLNQAEDYLVTAVRSRPWRVANRRLLARTYLLEGNFELARDVLLPVVDMDDVDANGLALLGLSESLLASPDSPIDGIRQGQLQLMRGEFDAALDTARALAAERDDDAAVLELLGQTYLARTHTAPAVAAFSAALAREPGNGRVRVQLARAHLANGNYEAGLRLLEPGAPAVAAGEGDSTRRSLITRWSDSLARSGRPDPVLLEGWLEREPGDRDARWLLAITYFNLERYADSARHFDVLAEELPGDAAIHNNLAWCYLRLNDERALAHAEEAYALAPDHAEIIDTLGWTLVMDGQAERALPLLEEAYLLLPDKPESAYRLAVALSRLAANEDARRLLETLLASGAGGLEGSARDLLAALPAGN